MYVTCKVSTLDPRSAAHASDTCTTILFNFLALCVQSECSSVESGLVPRKQSSKTRAQTDRETEPHRSRPRHNRHLGLPRDERRPLSTVACSRVACSRVVWGGDKSGGWRTLQCGQLLFTRSHWSRHSACSACLHGSTRSTSSASKSSWQIEHCEQALRCGGGSSTGGVRAYGLDGAPSSRRSRSSRSS